MEASMAIARRISRRFHALSRYAPFNHLTLQLMILINDIKRKINNKERKAINKLNHDTNHDNTRAIKI